MKFNVTLQVLVNLRVADIEAESQAEAIKTTDELVSDSYKLAKAIESETNCPIGAEWAELAEDPPAYALVDEVGDEEHERSRWFFNDPAGDWRPIDPINNSTPGQAPAAPTPDLLQVARCALADLEGLAQRLCIDLDDPAEEPAAQTVRELRAAIAAADLLPIRPPYEEQPNGDEGQDRKSYTDDQDRKDYTVNEPEN